VFVEERTVDVHFSRLRKAINGVASDNDKRPNLIRTVRGLGYALRTLA
jgi:two-component system phosphate regulon response regulator PhoB